MKKYIEPKFEIEDISSFTCPRCGVLAQQTWELYGAITKGKEIEEMLASAFCHVCRKKSIWLEAEMIYPACRLPYTPNEDLSDDIKKDYNEAVSICQESPRGAAALLRLCVQKLCIQLGEKGQNLNTDIGELLKKGLPKEIQQALDLVRVIGNNAVHPSVIDVDEKETVVSLFEFINRIAEVMISQPKRIQESFAKLSTSTKQQIQNRDSETQKKTN